MLTRLFLLFTLVPLLELAILVRMGQWLGFTPTIGLVLATGAVGALLARREGLRSWGAVRSELEQGRVPGEELFHALLVVLAGAFLVTPGVLTDVAGLSLLARPVRGALIRRIQTHLTQRVERGGLRVFTAEFGTGPDRFGKGPEEDTSGASGAEGGAGEEEGGPGRPGRVIDV